MNNPSDNISMKILSNLRDTAMKDFDDSHAVEIDLETGLPMHPEETNGHYKKHTPTTESPEN